MVSSMYSLSFCLSGPTLEHAIVIVPQIWAEADVAGQMQVMTLQQSQLTELPSAVDVVFWSRPHLYPAYSWSPNISKALNHGSNSLDDPQIVPRKPAPAVNVPSMSPVAVETPPSRAPPPIPPYEAINRKERPARGEYGRVPGMTENAWVTPPVLNQPIVTADSSLSPSPSILRKPIPQTYVEDVRKFSEPKTQQNDQLPASNDIGPPTPDQNPWDVSQNQTPQPHQLGQPVNQLPSSNPAGTVPRARPRDFSQIPKPGPIQHTQDGRHGKDMPAGDHERSDRRSRYDAPSHIPRPRSQQGGQNRQNVQVTQADAMLNRPEHEAQQILTGPTAIPRQAQNQALGGHLTQPAATPTQKILAPRSTSQPPETRRESRPLQPSSKLQKTPQSDRSASPAARSADASPRFSPRLQAQDKTDPHVVPPSTGDLNVPQVANGPITYHSDGGSSDGRGNRRLSWMPGGRSRQTSQDLTSLRDGANAWILDGHNRSPYDLQALTNAQQVSELWDDSADTFIYLSPRESGRGPSFRIPSVVISSSQQLRTLAFGEIQELARHRAKSFDGRSTLSVTDAARHFDMRNPHTPPYTPVAGSQVSRTPSDGSAVSMGSLRDLPREGHLYFPRLANLASKGKGKSLPGEVDHLVSVRNLFAFLMCRPLVLTKQSPTAFSTLCLVANHLKRLGFSNVDGSTYGEAASVSLDFYINMLDLADVRGSREKTLEGIVLGERLQSVELYNEAFTHAIGKYEDTKNMKSPVWDLVTPNTRNRLQRASWDLSQRQQSMQLRLRDCEFPSLFTGSAASTSTAASKHIRFKNWKTSFFVMRKHITSYYKELHGDWPPKAKSKKNNFTQSGFNRIFLKGLYTDFCQLYDLLVDRESLTTRSMNIDDKLDEDEVDIATKALRKILSEYDHSYPPVQPPVPFDLPKLPTLATIEPRHNDHAVEVCQQAECRRLQEHEVILLLTKSHNLDSDVRSPFLQAFHAFEQKEARGKSAMELVEQRFGYWLFLYVIIQAMPMLVMDAPGVRYAEGVEYFLCQPPKGGLPWMEDASSTRRSWYGITGSSGVVSLPSDIVEHGVEAIYRRSHCWVAAGKWLDIAHGATSPVLDPYEETQGLDDRRRSLTQESPVVDNGLENPYGRMTRQLSSITENANAPTVDSGRVAYQHGSPRARSASNHRRSIAIGLEPLPFPPSLRMSPQTSPSESPPLSNRQRNNSYGFSSESDLLAIRQSADAGASQGKSFDQILEDVKQAKPKKEKMKRRSMYGLGLNS